MRGGRAAELVAVLILALGTWLGFATAGAPAATAGREAPGSGDFSINVASRTLRAITVAPHPVGTAEHDRVRDYLVDQLRRVGADEAHIQSATGFNTLNGPLAATVANVVARKRGRKPGPAILLSAHYDAVPRSFGAGDDGVGVGAVLGTLAAITNGPPLEHDLIITLLDAEEEGLLGAEAFVDLHPWAKDVGVVLNFDGRGTRGPVYMFQTSAGNAPLIGAIAKAANARTNSLTGEVYRHLPSDTDLSIWLHSGLAVGALNFAHVSGFTNYHTPLDNMANLDERVMPQMGDYAVSTVRALDLTDLQHVRTTDEIYFDAPLVGVVHYPSSWSIIVAIDALVLVLVLTGLGLYRRTITLRGIGRGTVGLCVSLILPALATWVGWRLITRIHPLYGEMLQADPYNAAWYLLAAAGFTVAAVMTIQRRAGTWCTPLELAVAPMLLFGVVGLVVAFVLPGASYLFCWPLFAATMCASWWRRSEARGRTAPVWLAIFAVPALVLWAPLIVALEVALTAAVLPVLMVLLAVLLSLLSMPLYLTGKCRRWIVMASLVVSLVALVRAELASGATEARKRPDSLSFLVDADSAKAWWVTFDRSVDDWTATRLGTAPARLDLSRYGVAAADHRMLATATPPNSATAWVAPTIASHPIAGGQRIQLHLARHGDGEIVTVLADTAVAIQDMTINTRVLQNGSDDRYSPRYHQGATGTVLRYFGVPPEGIDLEFTILGNAHTALRVVSGVEGLPGMPRRPPTLMSKPIFQTDMTFTSWTVRQWP